MVKLDFSAADPSLDQDLRGQAGVPSVCSSTWIFSTCSSAGLLSSAEEEKQSKKHRSRQTSESNGSKMRWRALLDEDHYSSSPEEDHMTDLVRSSPDP